MLMIFSILNFNFVKELKYRGMEIQNKVNMLVIGEVYGWFCLLIKEVLFFVFRVFKYYMLFVNGCFCLYFCYYELFLYC